MSINTTIVLIALAAAISLFTFGQWLNADVAREPIDRSTCARLGTC